MPPEGVCRLGFWNPARVSSHRWLLHLHLLEMMAAYVTWQPPVNVKGDPGSWGRKSTQPGPPVTSTSVLNLRSVCPNTNQLTDITPAVQVGRELQGRKFLFWKETKENRVESLKKHLFVIFSPQNSIWKLFKFLPSCLPLYFWPPPSSSQFPLPLYLSPFFPSFLSLQLV